MQISNRLELRKEKHPTLGKILVLYSSVDSEGNAAYFIESDEEKELGMGLRLTKRTALKLAWQIVQTISRF